MIPIFPGSRMPNYGRNSKLEKHFESKMNVLVDELDDILHSLENGPNKKSFVQNYKLTSVIDQLLDVALDFSDLYEQELKTNVSGHFFTTSTCFKSIISFHFLGSDEKAG